MTIQEFSAAYLPQLEALKAQRQRELETLTKETRVDEAKFARIQLNIIDVFEKMYQASVKRAGAISPSASPTGINELTPVFEAYLGYFEKLPMSWKENLAACERHNSHEEAHIERLKLEQADAVRALFEACRAKYSV